MGFRVITADGDQRFDDWTFWDVLDNGVLKISFPREPDGSGSRVIYLSPIFWRQIEDFEKSSEASRWQQG